MKYRLSYENPSRQYLDIHFIAEVAESKTLDIQLPAWRPGRYELGNFAKNIQHWLAKDEKGNALKFKKLSKDLWRVDCQSATEVHVFYNYYAADLNAGSTYLDSSQLYVNPVNCLLYLPERQEETCQIQLDLPSDYQVATGMEKIGKNEYTCSNFDELADSPFIASNALKKISFDLEGHAFHLWFQGEIKLESHQDRILKDFEAYTKAQMEMFGDFPCPEYHYLFQILSQSAYHGVEHSNSTVIALGPSYAVFEKEGRYEDFLGVSSHELFHTWNIKRIRPVEMWPYDFSKENYSRLGYLAEGATTWYGDEMLHRSGVFEDASYFKTLEEKLDRHFNNPGALNLSVADSSFDTWLDGYVPGVPNRKSSIYVEGALMTLLLDTRIQKQSEGKHSFDDVMRSFYQDFYQKGLGVTEQDYQKTAERYAGEKLDDFFEAYVNGSKDMEQDLKDAFAFRGLKFSLNPAENANESLLGFRYTDRVISIYPGSPAEAAGLKVGDQIWSINSCKINNDLSHWVKYFQEDSMKFQLSDSFSNQREVEMQSDKTKPFYIKSKVERI